MTIFNAISTQLQEQLPFVAYRKPGEALLCTIFQQDNQLYKLQSYAEAGFIFAPFDQAHSTIIIPGNTVTTSHFSPSHFEQGANIQPYTTTSEEKENHLNLVKKGIAEIQEGHLKKVVLSRSLTFSTPTRSIILFQKLLQFYPGAFCYLWYHPKVGLWLGATPEILLTLENQKLTTMALAGTQKYKGEESPHWGRKELEEQQLVTNYIAETLGAKLSGLEISGVKTIRAGNLLHLRTELTGITDNINLGEILDALHPTPAVCGLPKDAAFAFINANENYNRGYYTGYLGELNITHHQQRNSNRKNQEIQAYRSIKKATTLFVNLRCMQLKNGVAHLYVGGGITKDSDPTLEWEETVAKTATMLRILK